jgi:hypothetical protein
MASSLSFRILNKNEVILRGATYLYKNTKLFTLRDRESDEDYDPEETWALDKWCGPAVTDKGLLAEFKIRMNLAKQMTVLQTNEDNYTAEVLSQRYTLYRDFIRGSQDVIGSTRLPIRLANPPEDVTENIVKFIIRNKMGDATCKWAKAVGASGDLVSEMEGLQEVKAFTSDGPCSFGPQKVFDVLYFLDLRRWLDNHIVLWRTDLNNNSSAWKSLKMNKTETNEEQCAQGRRPHIAFEKIYEQISGDCVKVYEGTFEEIFM